MGSEIWLTPCGCWLLQGHPSPAAAVKRLQVHLQELWLQVCIEGLPVGRDGRWEGKEGVKGRGEISQTLKMGQLGDGRVSRSSDLASHGPVRIWGAN